MNSILLTVKKLCNISAEDTSFDIDILVYLNSIFSILRQEGVGPAEGFYVSDTSAKWQDFIADPKELSIPKNYICSKCKLMFDPPQSGALKEALESVVKETEWRSYTDAGNY